MSLKKLSTPCFSISFSIGSFRSLEWDEEEEEEKVFECWKWRGVSYLMGVLALYSKETGVMATLIGAGFSAFHYYSKWVRCCNSNRNWKEKTAAKKKGRQSPGKMDEENFLDRGKLLLLTTDITVVRTYLPTTGIKAGQ